MRPKVSYNTEKMIDENHICKETIMAQLIHGIMLLFIVFILAEIRNVLVNSDPSPAQPLTIWEEVQRPL